MIVFGIVGQPGSGKDSAAEYIAKHYGFRHIPSGDVLREYIRSNNLGGVDRENMQKVVTELRKQSGDAVLIRIALKGASQAERLIISGLRNPVEAEAITKLGGNIISITAPIQERFSRAQHRGREGDDISLTEFTRLEQNENHGQTFNINKLIEDAEYSIANTGGYKQFFAKIDQLMQQLGFEKQ